MASAGVRGGEKTQFSLAGHCEFDHAPVNMWATQIGLLLLFIFLPLLHCFLAQGLRGTWEDWEVKVHGVKFPNKNMM